MILMSLPIKFQTVRNSFFNIGNRAGIKMVMLLLLFITSMVINVSTLAADINGIRVWDAPDHSRVVFDLSENASYQAFTLNNPRRLVIDIKQGKHQADLPVLTNNPRIETIRHGTMEEGVYRYVIEVKRALKKPNHFQLSPNDIYGHRLVIDLFDLDGAESPLSNTTAQSDTEPSSAEQSEVNTTKPTPIEPVPGLITTTVTTESADSKQAKAASSQTTAPLKRKKLLVAIDAGHGGEDPGAIGYRKIREKHLTLAIAKQLYSIVNKHPNMQAVLIRNGDYFIRLRDRTRKARKQKADMFISIHADAFTKKSASGFSVFALSQRGASSEMARTLAKKENAADLIGGVSLKDKDDLLAQVLLDLSMTNNISEGVEFGSYVLKELSKIGKLHSKRVEQAGFAVLKSPDIPSILVETGFVTNPSEAKKLSNKKYQRRIAEGIYNAILKYSNKNPLYVPQTTYTASASDPKVSASRGTPQAGTQAQFHRVKSGDNLSSIAQRYKTSSKKIRQWNNLRSSKIFVGQKLRVGSKTSNSNQVAASSQTSSKTKTIIHKVRSGQSLSVIAERYRVSIRSIKKRNKLKSNKLYVGQKLKVDTKVSSSSTTASKASTTSKKIVHRVKRGQTLSGIADKYGVSQASIKKASNLRSSRLQIGQRLTIITKTAQPKAIVHKVKRGETLSGIAQRYKSSTSKIKAANQISSNRLSIGQKLKIPTI